MDGIVRCVCCTDQIIEVENARITVLDVFGGHWVHMMDYDPIIDLITFHSEITSEISSDNLVTNVPPLSRGVELLVYPAVESESGLSDRSSEFEI